jgi:CheY-like chemotaxis protein
MSEEGLIGEPVEILLVEDNPADVELTRQGFLVGRLANRLHVTTNGDDAIDFLHRRGQYQDAPRPDLILLDLNLPGKDGRDVLADVKGDESLKDIPIIVLTTSTDEEDILRSYRLHANAYIAKPVDFSQFVDAVKMVAQYWFTLVKLPPKQES